MAFIDGFLDMLKSSVTHEPVTGRDDYAKPTYGAATTYVARVDYTRRKVTIADGRDVVAACTVWFDGTPTVTLDDRFTLPDGTQPSILSWDQPTDETGLKTHTKVYFG